jgi:hypothetical protein
LNTLDRASSRARSRLSNRTGLAVCIFGIIAK